MEHNLGPVGLRFGRLVVLAEVPRHRRRTPHGREWYGYCDCGGLAQVKTAHLGRTVSCGCWQREVRIENGRKSSNGRPSHGMSHTPTHNTWVMMQQRCGNPRHEHFRYYGGRGIRVCDEWLGPGGFARFLAEVGERPPGRTIDRIDNGGNYEPGNVRWATQSEQSSNQRKRGTA